MMTILKRLFYLSIILISASCFSQSISKIQPYVLIYSGKNTCEGCPEAVADIARKVNLPVKYVSHAKQIPRLLNHAAIFAIGGTEDNIEQMHSEFSESIVSSIKNYLKQGGNYLGICGGGFIAATYYMADVNLKVKGFNIIPALAVDYSETSKPHLETIQWYGKNVILYFQGGPTFILDKNAKDIHIIARYSNGDIAALESPYGNGKVVVIGPHPEADKTWLEEDGIDASHWQPRQELIVNLIKKMLLHSQ
jgi:glutamine amidotransferase-like uncharacterized protein